MDCTREWIALVLEQATALRAAGVLSISIDGRSVTFAELPFVPAKDDSKPDEQEPDNVDPFHDPASYPGGIVPGFHIEKLEIGE